MTLRTKILGAMALVLALTVGGSFLVLIRHQRTQLLHNTAEASSYLANTIRATLEHGMLANDPAEIRDVLTTVGRQPGIEGVFILDRTGVVKVANDPSQVGRPLPEDPAGLPPWTAQAEITQGNRTLILPRRPFSVFRSTSLIPNLARCHRCHGSSEAVLGTLVVDRSLEQVERQLRTNLAYMLTSAGLAFLLLTATTYAVLRRLVVAPLSVLGRAVRAVEAGDYDTPLSLQRTDEVGDVARTIDQMRLRILSHLEEVRRWGQELEVRVAERTQKLRESHAAILERERQIAALEAVRAATVTLSHHINNATAGIDGCRNVLAMTLNEQTDPRARYALDGIQASVRKISAVLHTLGDLTRIELTPFAGGVEAIDVEGAIRKTLARLGPDEGSPNPRSHRT